MSQRSRFLQAPRWIAEPQWMRPPLEPLPAAETSSDLKVLTLNVAHGRKLATHQAFLSTEVVRRNLAEIGELLQGSEADVVALQEADGPSAWSGNFDHVETLARLGDHTDFFRGEHNPFALGKRNLASGTALLGKYPLLARHSHRFGTNWRDTKGFVLATVPIMRWGGVEVDVVSLHLDPIMPSVRRQQVEDLVRVLTPRQRPLVVLGDFNCSWSEERAAFRPLVETLGLRGCQPERKAPTYPSRRPWRRLDWILVSRELEFTRYANLPAPVSDHLGVTAALRLRAGRIGQGEATEPDAGLAASA